ncbi:hypothetical protein [Janthinobacterium lividum]|uniref:hypothetical protein n=1 Tax=Janthinobacterium lividum TaxID=29581 RepID=UPI00159504E5|nr:hypothetical protein [Janthinobacterium lividum]QKY07504.1 hypothetical protein G8765_06800 [Janthinobacterium lividum]
MAMGFNSSLRVYLPTFDLLVRGFLKDSGLQTVFSGVSIYSQTDESACDLMASFEGLPQRPGSKKFASENIFITAKLAGLAKSGQLHLTHYGTEIGYFRQTNASAPLCDLLPITGYHYDFDCDGKKFNHPVFHAQPKITAGDRYIGRNQNITHRNYPEHDEIRTIRIPTPQMDIFSAIVMVLADHVALPADPNRKFGNFLEAFEKTMIKFDLNGVEKFVSTPFFQANPHLVQCWYPKPIPKGQAVARGAV